MFKEYMDVEPARLAPDPQPPPEPEEPGMEAVPTEKSEPIEPAAVPKWGGGEIGYDWCLVGELVRW